MNNVSEFIPLFQTVIWAVVILILLGIVYRVFQRLLSNGNNLEALNVNLRGVGFGIQLKNVQEHQKKQEEQIEALRFLAIHFVSSYELAYLSQLNDERSGPPNSRYFLQELYHLRSMGLIKNKEGKHLGDMLERSDVNSYAKITDEGRKYLTLLGALGIGERGITSNVSK